MKTIDTVFTHQLEMAAKFLKIEVANDPSTHQSIPVAIQSYQGQRRLKQFAFATLEEMAEANCELGNLYSEHQDGAYNPDTTEYYSELADVFTFCVELCILSGINAQELYTVDTVHKCVTDMEKDLRQILPEYAAHPDFWSQASFCEDHMNNFIMAFHELKMKPWKQSPYPGDLVNFKIELKLAIMDIIEHICCIIGYDELLRQYEIKHHINADRINTGK